MNHDVRSNRGDSYRPVSHRAVWWLRWGGAACFVGHGAFGVMTKEGWLPYFALFGIGRDLAFQLMPVIGWLDIAMGLSLLVTLHPVLLGWMVVWTIFTAALRPLSGESIWEFVERAANFTLPLALLALTWWSARPAGGTDGESTISTGRYRVVWRVLTIGAVALLVGHGVLELHQKAAFVVNAATIAPLTSGTLARGIGVLDLVLAVAIGALGTPALGVVVAVWKLATESLFLLGGASAWELVERGASFAIPAALACRARGGWRVR